MLSSSDILEPRSPDQGRPIPPETCSASYGPMTCWPNCVRKCSKETQSLIAILFAPPRMFSAFLSAVLTLALFEGAYITEIVRAGIESIEKGQWEAASGLGFNRHQMLRYIILPQAVRRILPPLAGQFISTIKDSAIVSVISIQELTFQGMELMAATHLTFEIWITITGLYLLLTLSCSMLVERSEHIIFRRRVARTSVSTAS